MCRPMRIKLRPSYLPAPPETPVPAPVFPRLRGAYRRM